MATSQSDRTSEKTVDIKCCRCLEIERISGGDSYCVICKKFYCAPCAGIHTKFPKMKDHRFLDKVLVQYLGPDGSPPGLTTQQRLKHQPQLTNIYSKPQEIARSVRLALTNRTYSNIHSSPEVTVQKREIGVKLKQKREIDVKLLTDTSDCRIWGSCITDDGSLLLTDRKNKKLKRIDMSEERVKDYLRLPVEPNAVCLISNTEAAVSLDNKTVQFVSLGNKLKASSKLTLNHYCDNVAHKNDKLFITDDRKTLYIHSRNGTQLQRITTYGFSKKIFKNTRHMTVSDAGVFVADASKGLVILDHQGNYLSTLTYPKVSGTQGVCTDGRNLFVCGWDSNNIVVIGHDYKLLCELGRVIRPMSMCYDPHKTRLIITTYNNSNKITVLELEYY